MASRLIISALVTLVVCNFCGIDFQSLGRHTWRCKKKLVDNTQEENNALENRTPVNNTIPTNSIARCCCGKECKGLRGLRRHQRSCRVLQGIGTELEDFMQNNEEELSNNDLEIEQKGVVPDVKQGIKLSTSESQWKSANDFFRAALPLSSINGDSLGDNIERFHETIIHFSRKIIAQSIKATSTKARKGNTKATTNQS